MGLCTKLTFLNNVFVQTDMKVVQNDGIYRYEGRMKSRDRKYCAASLHRVTDAGNEQVKERRQDMRASSSRL